MTSVLAWLDASSAEQRHVREIVALFTQQESRDELGLGQVRDVFSDRLFPGMNEPATVASVRGQLLHDAVDLGRGSDHQHPSSWRTTSAPLTRRDGARPQRIA